MALRSSAAATALACGCALLLSASPCVAIDNGKGITPPMGWRSWNLYGANVDQALLQTQMDAIVSRKRLVNGVPTSLADLGYTDVGLDDNWQACGSYGVDKFTYHDESGVPQVNTQLFPDMAAMTAHGHALNLTVGWYGNNCICSDHCSDDKCYAGDVKKTVEFGFDSIKLDGCGKQMDLGKWADYFNATGKSILIENCHWGNTLPTATECPYNYFRSSSDIRASYDVVMHNLMTVPPIAAKKLSRPGCWAYPDMLEVGCQHGPGGAGDPGLTLVEARTHFGAWCIVSSPLILSHDMTNDTISDAIWPIIANAEAIAVNQAWAGESGTLFAAYPNAIFDFMCAISDMPCWQMWSKAVNSSTGATAVLVINHSRARSPAGALSLTFAQVPSLSPFPASTRFTVRDLWAHTDRGTWVGSFPLDALDSRDSSMLVVTPVADSAANQQ